MQGVILFLDSLTLALDGSRDIYCVTKKNDTSVESFINIAEYQRHCSKCDRTLNLPPRIIYPPYPLHLGNIRRSSACRLQRDVCGAHSNEAEGRGPAAAARASRMVWWSPRASLVPPAPAYPRTARALPPAPSAPHRSSTLFTSFFDSQVARETSERSCTLHSIEQSASARISPVRTSTRAIDEDFRFSFPRAVDCDRGEALDGGERVRWSARTLVARDTRGAVTVTVTRWRDGGVVRMRWRRTCRGWSRSTTARAVDAPSHRQQ